MPVINMNKQETTQITNNKTNLKQFAEQHPCRQHIVNESAVTSLTRSTSLNHNYIASIIVIVTNNNTQQPSDMLNGAPYNSRRTNTEITMD